MPWFVSGVGAETPFIRDMLKYQEMSLKLHPKEGESTDPTAFDQESEEHLPFASLGLDHSAWSHGG